VTHVTRHWACCSDQVTNVFTKAQIVSTFVDQRRAYDIIHAHRRDGSGLGGRGGGGCGGCGGDSCGCATFVAHHWALSSQLFSDQRVCALVLTITWFHDVARSVFDIVCLLVRTGGMVFTNDRIPRCGSRSGRSSGSRSSHGSSAATNLTHHWAFKLQPWPYQGMIAFIDTITSTLSRGTLNLVLTNQPGRSCRGSGGGGSAGGSRSGGGCAHVTHQWAILSHLLTQPESQTFAQSYQCYAYRFIFTRPNGEGGCSGGAHHTCVRWRIGQVFCFLARTCVLQLASKTTCSCGAESAEQSDDSDGELSTHSLAEEGLRGTTETLSD